MSDEPFDEIDRLLGSGLSELAPEVEGADEMLAALRPRFQRARTRARVVKISGAVAALLVIGSVATLAAPSSQRTHVEVSAPPTTTPPTTRHRAATTTTVAPTTTIPETASTGSPNGGAAPAGFGSTTPTTGGIPTRLHTVPDTTPHTTPPDDHGGSGSGSGGGSGPGPGGSSPATTIPAKRTNITTYRSQGGSIRVRFSQGALHLVTVSPANGFHTRVAREQPDLIDVRFSNDHGEWRLRIRVEEGRPVREVEHT